MQPDKSPNYFHKSQCLCPPPTKSHFDHTNFLIPMQINFVIQISNIYYNQQPCYNLFIIFKGMIPMNKKLQVFISSTYKDLIDERQAAVQAVLESGHIPAGMELFKAGNLSQLETIKKWINDSDVYMLILGGRYGSIEPISGKSYTQLEYEYALSKNIPVFSVVLTDAFLLHKTELLGKNVFENDNPDLYKNFKNEVMSKIIKFVDDEKDIKISIFATIQEFINDYNLEGWIRGDYDYEELKNDYFDLKSRYNQLSKRCHYQQVLINKINALINSQ